MFDCHQSEESFWRTANPSRLIRLFDAHFPPKRAAAAPSFRTPWQEPVPAIHELFGV